VEKGKHNELITKKTKKEEKTHKSIFLDARRKKELNQKPIREFAKKKNVKKLYEHKMNSK
jgi:hypothetical protein